MMLEALAALARGSPLDRMAATGAILLSLLLCLPLHAAQAVIEVGAQAPEFSLKDFAGGTVSLERGTSQTWLLVFLKPNDKHLREAISDLNAVLDKNPEINNRLNRAAIICRYDAVADARHMAAEELRGWPSITDEDDTLYKSYKIIATPTIVIVGPDGRVAAVNPGYDPNMVQHVRLSLAKVMGVKLPATALATPEKPNFDLQMARQFAKNHLWTKALEYYEKAEKEGPLSPKAQLEVAEAHLNLKEIDQAQDILKRLSPPDPDIHEKWNELNEWARQLQQAKSRIPVPPKIK